MFNIVEQGSFQDGLHPWFDFEPEVSGLQLSIPAWTFVARGVSQFFAADSHTFVPDATYDTEVKLYLTPSGYELHETILDGDRHEPLSPPGFPGQGAPVVMWFTIPAGYTDLDTVNMNVLRSVER